VPPISYPLLTALLLAAGPVAHAVDCETPIPESQWSVMQPLATETLMLDIVRAGETLVVVGERGHVLISEDQGRSWTQQRTPTRALLTGTWFHDRNLGWAVGHDAVILRTEDGGETWCRVHAAPELDMPLFDVWFADAQNGFAIGAYGYFLRSSDGGRTWQEETLEEIEAEGSDENEDTGDGGDAWGGDDWLDNITDMHLNRVVLDAADRLYLVAEAGIVFRSDDQGHSWHRLSTPYDGSFFNGLPPDNDSLLIFGLRGNMFRTWDAGSSWRKVSLPVDSSLFGGARLRDGHIMVVGSAGVMLLSDEGESYRLVQRPDRKALTSAMGTGDGAVIVIGEPGVERIEPGELLAN